MIDKKSRKEAEKDKDIMLTIGMIVRDEEENLGRCLEALKPLMDKITCQLVIVDNGSRDKTVDIARKYTEEVYSHTWQDNFAEARNFGLEKAKGKWFMFLDADEVFEDPTPIADFFLSGEYRNYDNAAYRVRNYSYLNDSNDYVDTYLARLFSIRDFPEERRFKGAIHEHIPMTGRHKEIDAFVHHYSYAKDVDEKTRMEKHERNLKLLLSEIEKEPQDSRLGYLLTQQYKGTDEEAMLETVNRYWNIVKDNDEDPFYFYFLKHFAMSLKTENPERALEALSAEFAKKREPRGWDLDLYATLADVYHLSGQYKEAEEACEKYEKLYRQHEKGSLKWEVAERLVVPNFSQKPYFMALMLLKSKALIRQERYEDAAKCISDLGYRDFALTELREAILLLMLCGSHTDKPKLAVNYMEKIFGGRASEKVVLTVESACEEYLDRDPGFAGDFAVTFLESNAIPDDIPYSLLQCLRATLHMGKLKIRETVRRYLDMVDESQAIYPDMMVFGTIMGDEHMLERLSALMHRDDMEKCLPRCMRLYSNLGIMAASEFENHLSSGKLWAYKYTYWSLQIMCCALLYGDVEEDTAEAYIKVFETFANVGYDYVKATYSVAVLKEENLPILPDEDHFMYLAGLGIKELDAGREKEGVAYLRRAAAAYPDMSEILSKYLDTGVLEERGTPEDQKLRQIEFESYAMLIKERILEIDKAGMRDEAIKLLDSYASINPKDKEGIAELSRKLEVDN